MENVTLTPRSNCSIYNDRNFIAVAAVNQAVSAISILACLFAIFVIVIFKKWKTFSQRLIAYLIITNLLLVTASCIHRVDYFDTNTEGHMRFCVFSAYFAQNTVWMTINSITAITVYLFLAAACGRLTDKYEVAYIVFIFVVPLTFNWIPFIKSSFGRAGVWCWIRSLDTETCEPFLFGQALQYVLFYAPIFLLLLVLVVLYLITLFRLHQNKKYLKGSLGNRAGYIQNRIVKAEVVSLLAYPVIYVLTNIPLVANRIQGWLSPREPSLVLWYLSAFCIPLQGVIVVLAFTLDADTRRRLRWSHLRAAVAHYRTSKVVSEYQVGETDADGHEASYTKFTDNSVMMEKLMVN